MTGDGLAGAIKQRALALGYENCGIIRVEELADYADRLDERFRFFPDQAEYGQKYYGLARPQLQHPWAKAAVVCVRRYGKYKMPPQLDGRISKFFLADGRVNPASPDHQASLKFEAYLHDIGLRTLTNRTDGVIPLRWAAYKAGLGIIRKNNFFCTQHGSWVYLEAWLIDQPLELKDAAQYPPCPENCGLCVRACSTHSLAAPYMTRRSGCICCLTTKVYPEGDFLATNIGPKVKQWVYGCDDCQDACPFNRHAWEPLHDYPGLDALAGQLSLEKILGMSDDYYRNVLQPRFWYLKPDEGWKWQVNALNAMRNAYRSEYAPAVAAACGSPSEPVRLMARHVRDGH